MVDDKVLRVRFANSGRMIARAGLANLLLPIACVIALLIGLAVEDLSGIRSLAVAAGVLAVLFWLWIYSHTACSLVLDLDTVAVTRPFDTQVWVRGDIASVASLRIPSSVTCVMLIKRRGVPWRDFMFWVAPHTDLGAFRETCAAIETNLRAR